jgi:site-specific recombinase XerD
VTTTTAPGKVGADLRDLLASFTLSLRAGNKAPRTIEVYSDSLRQLTDYLSSVGAPTDIARIGREHIEFFEVHLLEEGRKASTVSIRHRSLQAFFKWAVAEREIPTNPMANMAPPIVPEQQVPVPSEADLKRLLGAMSGKTFEATRDMALLRLLIDTGVRSSEAMGLKVADVSIHGVDTPHATVLGKGRRPRSVPLGAKTALAIDRYLRARTKHPHAELDWLWIGTKRLSG